MQILLLLKITCYFKSISLDSLKSHQAQRDIIFELRRIAFDAESEPNNSSGNVEKRKSMYTRDYKKLGFIVSILAYFGKFLDAYFMLIICSTSDIQDYIHTRCFHVISILYRFVNWPYFNQIHRGQSLVTCIMMCKICYFNFSVDFSASRSWISLLIQSNVSHIFNCKNCVLEFVTHQNMHLNAVSVHGICSQVLVHLHS